MRCGRVGQPSWHCGVCGCSCCMSICLLLPPTSPQLRLLQLPLFRVAPVGLHGGSNKGPQGRQPPLLSLSVPVITLHTACWLLSNCLCVVTIRLLMTDSRLRAAAVSHCLLCSCLYGGASKSLQGRQISRGPQIIIATPGRLLDFVGSGELNVNRVSKADCEGSLVAISQLGFRVVMANHQVERWCIPFAVGRPHHCVHQIDHWVQMWQIHLQAMCVAISTINCSQQQVISASSPSTHSGAPVKPTTQGHVMDMTSNIS